MHERPIEVSLAAIQAQAVHRPSGYVADVLSHGRIVGDTVELSVRAHRDLVAKYRRIEPAEEWPAWTLVASLFSVPGDIGVGDTVARELGGSGSEAFKRHHEAVFGVWAKPCGCAGQVASWDAEFPYS